MNIRYNVRNCEKRLAAWMSFRERMLKSRQECHNKTITISREFGCEGYPLAEALATKMERLTGVAWHVFDRNLIQMISEKENIPLYDLQTFNSSSHYLDVLSVFMPHWQTGGQVFEVIAKNILKIADLGNCIIVGRGSSILTQKFKNCYHFRLEAPFEFRVKSIMERLNMNEKDAIEFVKTNQTERAYFLKRFLNVESIDNSSYFHMKFNNEKVCVENISEIIANFVNSSNMGHVATRPVEDANRFISTTNNSLQ